MQSPPHRHGHARPSKKGPAFHVDQVDRSSFQSNTKFQNSRLLGRHEQSQPPFGYKPDQWPNAEAADKGAATKLLLRLRPLVRPRLQALIQSRSSPRWPLPASAAAVASHKVVRGLQELRHDQPIPEGHSQPLATSISSPSLSS
ncbi:hypothetical protein L1887_57071 [Cichorium endivia]|nr:hypothetical protein L1887_57071 [Cichorium endivia]